MSDYQRRVYDLETTARLRNEVIEEIFNIENDPARGQSLRKLTVLYFELQQLETIAIAIEDSLYNGGVN